MFEELERWIKSILAFVLGVLMVGVALGLYEVLIPPFKTFAIPAVSVYAVFILRYFVFNKEKEPHVHILDHHTRE